MNSKYWNELSHDEQSKIENEWYISNWYKNAKEESKSITSNILRYGVIFVIFLFLTLLTIDALFLMENRNDDENTAYLIIYLGFYVFLILIIGIISYFKTSNLRYDFLEEEKKKWLLKNHNVIK